MTKYTDQQIIAAIKEAGGKKHPGTVYPWELTMYKQVIDALPESATDDWQECRFEDIRKGDRVKRVRIYDSGTTDTREGVVTNIDAHGVSCTHNRVIASSEDKNSTIVKLYRIPAPVQHPDPLEHPVIIVELYRGSTGYYWNGSRYSPMSSFPGQQDPYLEPDEITDWTPGKVVEDDR